MNARDYLARAEALGPLLDAAGPRMDRARELAPEVVAALHEAGLYRMLLPRSLGGGELAPADFIAVIEAVAKHDASTAWCLGQAGGCAMSAAYLPPETARAVFGPADAVLAWGPISASARARVVDGGYILNGTWQFASGSRHATWLGGHASAVDRGGTPIPRVPGMPHDQTFLFPRASAVIADTWHVVGLRATGSDTYTVKDLFIPNSHAYVRDNPATRSATAPLYGFSHYQIYGAAFASVALGIARATQDAFIALAREKTGMLAAAPMRDNAAIQGQIAECEIRLRAMRGFLHETLRGAHDAAAASGTIDLDRRLSLRMASTYATHQAKHVVDACYQAAGATAIFEENPFERRFRDVHAVAQQSQARWLNMEAVGRVLLGDTGLIYSI